MAVLQALISLLGRSLGKILNAIFGWAVVALFGRTSPRKQTALSVLVAAAAVWPILLLGIALPRLAVFLASFVPLSGRAPRWVLRLVWLGLALIVPIAVGIAVATRRPPGSPHESRVRLALRGFPITLAIASAFVFVFFTVPVLRLVSAVRRRTDEHVPCITEGAEYDVVRMQIERVLRVHGVEASPAEPSWWLSAPAAILRRLGGRALRGFVPTKMGYWRGPALELAFYPSDVLIRGSDEKTAWTHGLLAEALVDGPALQTTDPEAQALERRIRQLWRIHDENPHAHTDAPRLAAELRRVVVALGGLKVNYEDWQVLYRQTVQLDRTLSGKRQLLDTVLQEGAMEEKRNAGSPYARPLERIPTSVLLRELADQGRELARKEIALAREELRNEARRGIRMGGEAVAAGACAILFLSMLLVAAAFAIALVLPGWAAALIVACLPLLLAIGLGLDAWRRRVREPMPRTKHSVQETIQWARERTI